MDSSTFTKLGIFKELDEGLMNIRESNRRLSLTQEKWHQSLIRNFAKIVSHYNFQQNYPLEHAVLLLKEVFW